MKKRIYNIFNLIVDFILYIVIYFIYIAIVVDRIRESYCSISVFRITVSMILITAWSAKPYAPM